MNGYPPHVYVIPEDDRDRQLANGFVLHDQIDARRIEVIPPAGGWREVLKTFEREYVPRLRKYSRDLVILLVDFDGDYASRRAKFAESIPSDLVDRVFVVGARDTPEDLRRELGGTLEQIGTSLADDCYSGAQAVWAHEHLKHNDPDRQRMIEIIRPFLFTAP